MSEREATRPGLPDLVRPMLAIPGELPSDGHALSPALFSGRRHRVKGA